MTVVTDHNAFAPDTPPSPVVRFALVRAPLDLLGQENRNGLRRLRREIKGIGGANFAERLMHVDHYLDCFDRAAFIAPGSEVFLRAGLSSTLSTLGLFGKAVMNSDTLWEALCTTRDYIGYELSSARVALRVRKGRCRIVYDLRHDSHPGTVASVQYFTALFIYVMRHAKWYRGADVRLVYPGARSAHFALFPEVITLRSGPFGIIEFDDKLLRSPMVGAEPWKNAAATAAMARFRSANLAAADLPGLVHELQLASIMAMNGPIALPDVAALLDLPARTLQAQIKNANTAFDKIRKDVLHQVARQELEAGRPINDISDILGFSHRQSFSEAFSSWEGQSPSVFASRGHRPRLVG